MAEPVEVYEVSGAGPVRSRFQAAAARGLSRFVGRDAEVEQLRVPCDWPVRVMVKLLRFVGEPGVGKSRLFFEFTRSHLTQRWLILESGSVSYGKATAYLSIVELLKAYFKIQDRDEHCDIREKVTGKLLALDRSLGPMLPAFRGVRVSGGWRRPTPPRRILPSGRRSRTRT